MRKLYRHTRGEKHVAGGVFSGVGEWLDVNPGILRAGYIFLGIMTGILPAVLLYLAAMFMIKKHPDDAAHKIIDVK